MAYIPSPTLSAASVTDSSGGTASRTIPAADSVVYSQSGEANERASFAAYYAELRAIVPQTVGAKGGGYRPIATVATLGNLTTGSGSTIAAPLAVYDQANEEAFRYQFATRLNELINDVNALRATTAPRPAFVRLTDNSGGTPQTSIGVPGSTYTGTGENNSRATWAAKLNEIADALGLPTA